MRQPIEVAIELTAEDLLSPGVEHCVEIDDIDTISAPQIEVSDAAADTLPPTEVTEFELADDAFEIELSASEMDELLGGPIRRP